MYVSMGATSAKVSEIIHHAQVDEVTRSAALPTDDSAPWAADLTEPAVAETSGFPWLLTAGLVVAAVAVVAVLRYR
jgi:hypothetical protein